MKASLMGLTKCPERHSSGWTSSSSEILWPFPLIFWALTWFIRLGNYRWLCQVEIYRLPYSPRCYWKNHCPPEGQEFDEKVWLALWNRTWLLGRSRVILPLTFYGSSWGCIRSLRKLYLCSSYSEGAYSHSILPEKHSKIVGVTQLFAIPYTFI